MAEREKNGRFAKGNPGGPGNPFAAQVAKLRAVILACLPEETMRVIVQAMIRQAMRGDVAAAKLLFQYALGKPIEVPLPEAEEEVEEPEEEAVSKREETASEAQPGTDSKRDETEGEAQPGTDSKREETGRSADNKRRKTGRSEPVRAGDGGMMQWEVEEMVEKLMHLWKEDQAQRVGGREGGVPLRGGGAVA